MMHYKGAKIQILDLPGLISGASEGRGRGREILSAVRNVDLILFMIDAQHREHIDVMAAELYKAGLRLNQKKPDIVISKKAYGGIIVNSTIPLTHLNELLIRSIASEFVINADITLREDLTEDQLIDSFAQNRVYVSALVVINKTDLIPLDSLRNAIQKLREKKWDGLKS
jgi:ribosome-interacting GTPase 1